MTPDPGYGDALRARRLAQGVTIEQLASALAVSRRSIERWESGTTVPSRAKARRLAELLEAPDLATTPERRIP